MIFKGVLTALITPFKDNKIDKKALEVLIQRQIDASINGIVIGGSTGEGNSLLDSEYYELIEAAVEISNKRISIIAGQSCVSTREALEKVVKLNDSGIDGIMCTVPHYIKPEQDGIYKHFEEISKLVTVPVMLYAHPGRTGSDIEDKTLMALSKLDNIVALKDASSDLERPLRILPNVSADFTMMTGDDSKTLAYSANGGMGCVSVMANMFPKICKKIDKLWCDKSFSQALDFQRKLTPAFAAIFAESNPIGAKYAVSKMGFCSSEIKLPLTVARLETAKKIDQILKDLMRLEEDV